VKDWLGFVVRYALTAVVGTALIVHGRPLLARAASLLAPPDLEPAPAASDPAPLETRGTAPAEPVPLPEESAPPAVLRPSVGAPPSGPGPLRADASLTADPRPHNPYAGDYRAARRAYREFRDEVERLRALRDASQGPERMAYADQLQSMRAENLRLSRGVEDAAARYRSWEPETDAAGTPTGTQDAAREAP